MEHVCNLRYTTHRNNTSKVSNPSLVFPGIVFSMVNGHLHASYDITDNKAALLLSLALFVYNLLTSPLSSLSSDTAVSLLYVRVVCPSLLRGKFGSVSAYN